jgi:hypothetical protein
MLPQPGSARQALLLIVVVLFVMNALHHRRMQHRRRMRMYLAVLCHVCDGAACLPTGRVWAYERSTAWWDVEVQQHFHARRDPAREFRRRYRVNPATFQWLCTRLSPLIQAQHTNWRRAVPVEKRLAIGLYHLAHGATFCQLSDLFGVGESTSCHEAIPLLLHQRRPQEVQCVCVRS